MGVTQCDTLHLRDPFVRALEQLVKNHAILEHPVVLHSVIHLEPEVETRKECPADSPMLEDAAASCWALVFLPHLPPILVVQTLNQEYAQLLEQFPQKGTFHCSEELHNAQGASVEVAVPSMDLTEKQEVEGQDMIWLP